MKEKLKNPVWSSLNETHRNFAVEYNGVKFYKPEMCNFGAIYNNKEVSQEIDKYANICQDFYVVGDRPKINDHLIFKKEVPCHQMVLKEVDESFDTSRVVKLDASYIDEIYDLIWLTMPGYYQKKTYHLGNYYGVLKNDKLVAIAGERLQSDFFIEISAVVTHPEYRGKGYAKQLVMHAVKKILEQNKIPILHVAQNNKVAIKIYKELGFKILQTMVWNHYQTIT